MPTLIIIRHGQSIYNLENRFTGSLDVELTQFGKEEARLAGLKLINFKFDIAYTSTMKRAKESLRIILETVHQNSIVIIENQALNERNYGRLQGLDKNETITKFGIEQVELWRRSYAIRPPSGESLEDTFNRMIPFYEQEIEPELQLNKTIIIVAHGNSLRALVMYLENISKEAISNVNIPTGIPKQYIFDKKLKILETSYLL